MRLAFYAPFKPVDHPRLSGDVTIARDLVGFFDSRGHETRVASPFSLAWIYWRPWRWPLAAASLEAARRRLDRWDCEAFFTYHSYYRSPDLLGPWCRRPGRPYFIFAPAYSTKRRKRLKTWPGFQLNKMALLAADHVFANKLKDHLNLARVVPPERLSYIRPGIRSARFQRDEAARAELREKWDLGDIPTVASAAMFRPGVKVEGLIWVINTCAALIRQGVELRLIIAGQGPAQARLESLARSQLGKAVRFCGFFPRDEMRSFYSAGDVFAFPGINEGLGMAYLEAQACGLPAVAWDHDGAPEVIEHGHSGFITPSFDGPAFGQALKLLLEDAALRRDMGTRAREFVRQKHELERNYITMEQTMIHICQERRERRP